MRLMRLVIAFWFITGWALGFIASEILWQSLADAPERQQSQILIQLFDRTIKSEPETALGYAIQAEKLAVKYAMQAEISIPSKGMCGSSRTFWSLGNEQQRSDHFHGKYILRIRLHSFVRFIEPVY